jgi:hypothetical protein
MAASMGVRFSNENGSLLNRKRFTFQLHLTRRHGDWTALPNCAIILAGLRRDKAESGLSVLF